MANVQNAPLGAFERQGVGQTLEYRVAVFGPVSVPAQRGIAGEALEVLLDYGRERYDHTGHVVIFFDKAARRRLAREAGTAARKELARLSRTYAVLSTSGAVLT
jgi:hypothetical protein